MVQARLLRSAVVEKRKSVLTNIKHFLISKISIYAYNNFKFEPMSELFTSFALTVVLQ